MPSLECPAADCGFATADVDIAAATVLMQIHANVAHPAILVAPPAPAALAHAPRMERPRIDHGVDMVAWNSFLRRWDLFRAGSHIDDNAAPRQLLECASEHLSYMVLNADPGIATKTVAQVTATLREHAVIPVAISVLRADLAQLRQAPDELFCAFAARVQGKAETCEFSMPCTCTCGLAVMADYTAAATRDVLLAGIADTDIRRETLGVPDIHRAAINDVIALVEGKEIARNALPSASSSAISSFKRNRLPPAATSGKCATCRAPFEPVHPEHRLC